MTGREILGDRGKPLIDTGDLSNSTYESYWELETGSTDAFDIHTTHSYHLGVAAVNQDTYDSVLEPEPAAVILLKGGDIGQLGRNLRYFLDGATGQAGIVFGYKNPNDYWIHVRDAADGREKVYHIHNGSKTLIADQSTSEATNWFFSRPKSRRLLGATLSGGFPSGRVGLYSNTTEVRFNWHRLSEDADARDMAGRWSNSTAMFGEEQPRIDPDVDRLLLRTIKGVGGYANRDMPIWLEGVWAQRFELTFSLHSNSTTTIHLAFNGTDLNDYDAIRIWHFDLAPRYGYEMDDGMRRDVTETIHQKKMPTPVLAGDVLWYRVISDGSSITILCQKSATEPSDGSWSTSTHKVYESSDFDFAGGKIGFLAESNYGPWVDDLTLKLDTDDNGSYETLHHEESFTLDGPSGDGYAQEAPTHDAAGNLTYDGVYAYTYDGWNRMVAVTKAWRTDNDPLEAVQLGAVVQEVEYDGAGRRIVQYVKNSPPLNATYHYYYDGQSVVEVRNGSDLVLKQQVWGNLAGGYIDELVQIGMNDDPTDGTEDDVESFYYALQDANYNLLGLVDESGVLVERYEYTPYGERTVYFSPGVNDTGLHAPTTTSRRWALAGGGTGSFALGQPYGLSEVGHQGLHHDEVTGLVHNRARMLHPKLGRFMQRDPLGYVDGGSLYAYYAGMHGVLDPTGHSVIGNVTVTTRLVHSTSPIHEWPSRFKGLVEELLVDRGLLKILELSTKKAVVDYVTWLNTTTIEDITGFDEWGPYVEGGVDGSVQIAPTIGVSGWLEVGINGHCQLYFTGGVSPTVGAGFGAFGGVNVGAGAQKELAVYDFSLGVHAEVNGLPENYVPASMRVIG